MLGLFLRNIIHEVEMVFSLPRRLTQKNQSLVLTHSHPSKLLRASDWLNEDGFLSPSPNKLPAE